ncbi:MAG TPA: hypothetical protein VNO43_17585 [Candidatus Eisenbacteria bacterium]|nr:hypothetical protein [Candidatus Eisenbacteria bacterium]
MKAYGEENVGNIVSLEHVNVQVPDQSLATLFYVVGLGLTRDPYLNVGLDNMWVNVGEQQFHLPTGPAQLIGGHIGLVMPDLESAEQRLGRVAERLNGTRFAWGRSRGYLEVTCPWGNHIRCYPSGEPAFGDIGLGLVYVEFRVARGVARAIGKFYEAVFGAPSAMLEDVSGPAARVAIGRHQALIFRESDALEPYDGHHVAVYVADFSRPYRFLSERGLVTEDVRNHQFRFQTLVEPSDGRSVFELEHEVRSLRHPMYGRRFVNRDPNQSQRNYRRGRDDLIPFRG